MIFQDPYSSLNPRKKAWELIAEPLFINTSYTKNECYKKSLEAMEKVNLHINMANYYPHMFSGGQRQRIGIARALVTQPKILICDEPVSALDVSIQAQIINLLLKLQKEMNLTYLFISHDLHVVNHISDQLMVMYLGKIVEFGKREDVFNKPLHPYSQALIKSCPSINEIYNENNLLKGELPSPLNPPSGCSFHKRCPIAKKHCSTTEPQIKKFNEHLVRCPEI